jgi:hypothetical protein
MKLVSTLKKTVSSVQELLDPLGLNRNKPRFLFATEKSNMTDPAGNPRTIVYKREIDLGNGPSL